MGEVYPRGSEALFAGFFFIFLQAQGVKIASAPFIEIEAITVKFQDSIFCGIRAGKLNIIFSAIIDNLLRVLGANSSFFPTQIFVFDVIHNTTSFQ